MTPLATFPISMIVHKDHPMAKRDCVYLEDLMENDLYLESDSFKIHHIIKDACNKRGFQPDIVFQTSGFSLCRSVVSRGSGISVVVDDIYHEMQAPNVVKIPFHPDEDLHWDVCMITRSGEVVNESVQIFQKFVKKRLLLD